MISFKVPNNSVIRKHVPDGFICNIKQLSDFRVIVQFAPKLESDNSAVIHINAAKFSSTHKVESSCMVMREFLVTGNSADQDPIKEYTGDVKHTKELSAIAGLIISSTVSLAKKCEEAVVNGKETV